MLRTQSAASFLSTIFGEQPKISAPDLDFCDKVRYHRINFPNRK